jgi:hypothetical protein
MSEFLDIKAYWVQEKDAEWGMFIHAKTTGQAKQSFKKSYPEIGEPDFVDIRVTRCKGNLLDMVPFTDYSLLLAGAHQVTDEDFPNAFLDFCPCEMCRKEKERA